MNQAVSINFNDAEFQKTLEQYLSVTSRELSEALNAKLFYIAAGAAKKTPKATREQIEQELGVVGYRLEFGKRGKILASSKRRKSINAITDSTSILYLIINRRLGRAGKKGAYGASMRLAVADLLAKRFRSVGTLKAGWTHAIRRLGAALGYTFQNEGASASVRGRSTATVARPGWTPECSLEYNVNSYDQAHRPHISRDVQRALSAAFQDELRSMQQYIIGKLQGTANRMAGRKMGPEAAMSEVQRVMRGGV
jgi:hypothetical protein